MPKFLVVLYAFHYFLNNYVECSIPSMKHPSSVKVGDITPSGVDEFNPSGPTRVEKPVSLIVDDETVYEDEDGPDGRITPYSKVIKSTVNSTKSLSYVQNATYYASDSEDSESYSAEDSEDDFERLQSRLANLSLSILAQTIRSSSTTTVVPHDLNAARSAITSPCTPHVSDVESDEDEECVTITLPKNYHQNHRKVLDIPDAFDYDSAAEDDDSKFQSIDKASIATVPSEESEIIDVAEGLCTLFNTKFDWPKFPEFVLKDDTIVEIKNEQIPLSKPTPLTPKSVNVSNANKKAESNEFALFGYKKYKNIAKMTNIERFQLSRAIFQQIKNSYEWKSSVKHEDLPKAIHLFRLALALRRISGDEKLMSATDLDSFSAILEKIEKIKPNLSDLCEIFELLIRSGHTKAARLLHEMPIFMDLIDSILDSKVEEGKSEYNENKKFMFLHKLAWNGYVKSMHFFLKFHPTMMEGLDSHQIALLSELLLINGTLTDSEVLSTMKILYAKLDPAKISDIDLDVFAELIKDKRCSQTIDFLYKKN